jgi:hypothetical protein
MAQWAVVISNERYEGERLFHHETLELNDALEFIGPNGAQRPAGGDEVLVLTGQRPPSVVALGRVRDRATGPLVISYTRRAFDQPQPADQLVLDGALTRLDPATYRSVADRIAPPTGNATWLVSLALPIEASSPPEAVRQFWTYVMELGPRELPAFVWPVGDELAMQAYVLGEEANLDPEED